MKAKVIYPPIGEVKEGMDVMFRNKHTKVTEIKGNYCLVINNNRPVNISNLTTISLEYKEECPQMRKGTNPYIDANKICTICNGTGYITKTIPVLPKDWDKVIGKEEVEFDIEKNVTCIFHDNVLYLTPYREYIVLDAEYHPKNTIKIIDDEGVGRYYDSYHFSEVKKVAKITEPIVEKTLDNEKIEDYAKLLDSDIDQSEKSKIVSSLLKLLHKEGYYLTRKPIVEKQWSDEMIEELLNDFSIERTGSTRPFIKGYLKKYITNWLIEYKQKNK
jgi:hypothetical protein